ncbi:MAG: DUF4304 domain-containing protein [Clostridia bacterium]|nr:DUF4304 domain-containing protein [Clostridia bacterium]
MMTEEQKRLVREQLLLGDDFQTKWEKYRKVFGKDIDTLFGDDYANKIRLSEGLEHLLSNRFSDAYHVIRHLESACKTDADRRIFARLIKLCLNEKEMAKAKIGDWVKQSHGGYYQIIKRTPEYAVIKRAFDHKFVYAKQSVNVDGFAIELTDLKTYQFVEKEDLLKIKSFFASNPDKEKEFLRYTDTVLSFREALLNANFCEAEWEFRQFHFYRCTLENVAFIVNLEDYGDHVGVTYGFTSIAEQDHLKHYGEDNNSVKLRFCSVIKNEQDQAHVANAVKSVYAAYFDKSKDEILSLKKERQKQFLQKIAEKLKPLGFKKKGTKWTKPLDRDFCLEFEAQKSRWSDEYYFNVSVYHKEVQFPQCYATRLNTNGKGIYNWQLMTDGELDCLLNGAIQSVLTPIINTPLAELGCQTDIWQGCTCQRNKCEACWVQKNLWEANQAESSNVP